MIKQIASIATSLTNSKCNFDRSLFILGHMRCGSTALSHILCSHPQISGYGEAHIRYERKAALGLLVFNQLRRNAYRKDAYSLFDKILHSRYDSGAISDFYNARAIFMVRDPVDTIHSIRRLFTTLGSQEYSNDTLASDYYEERVTSLLNLWERFSPERRIGLSYAGLTAEPDIKIAGISRMLDLIPPLTNNYLLPKNPLGHGAGDPLASHKHNKIVANSRAPDLAENSFMLQIPDARAASLKNLYLQALKTVT
jgi:Sulfotransferase family